MVFERFIGKTLEDALAQAAQAKGVEKEELHYTVTEEKDVYKRQQSTLARYSFTCPPLDTTSHAFKSCSSLIYSSLSLKCIENTSLCLFIIS